MIDADELVELLVRRHDVLESLIDAPKERHVLVDHLDASKSTVYKGVSQLQESGLVEHTSDGLRPTLFGIVALQRYEELAQAAEFESVLAHLPADAIDPSALADAEVVTPDDRSVDRHLARIRTMIRGANVVRGFSPAISPDYLDLFRRRTRDEGFTAEIVLPTELVDALGREHADAVEEILSADGVTLRRTETTLPFSLLIASSAGETEVGIEVGEGGLATGIVINDTVESLDWAEAVYERYRRTAEPVAVR